MRRPGRGQSGRTSSATPRRSSQPTIEQRRLMQPTWQALSTARSSASAAPRDHRPQPADSSSRTTSSRSRAPTRAAVRPDRVVQPLEIRGPAGAEIPPDIRPAVRRPQRVAGVSARSTTDAPPDWRTSTPGAAPRARPPCPSWSRAHVARPEPLRLPGRRRLHGAPAARSTWRRIDSSVGRPTPTSRCLMRSRVDRRGGLVYLSSARSAAPMSADATPDRGPPDTPHRYIVSKARSTRSSSSPEHVGAEFSRRRRSCRSSTW